MKRDESEDLSKAIEAVKKYKGKKTVANIKALLNQQRLWPDDFVEEAKKGFVRRLLRAIRLVNVIDNSGEKPIRVYVEPSALTLEQIEGLIRYHSSLATHHRTEADKYRALRDRKTGQLGLPIETEKKDQG